MFSETLFTLPPSGEGVAGEESCRFWTRPDGGLCAQHVRVRRTLAYRPHSHPEYTLVLCLAGAVHKSQLGLCCEAGVGELLISNAGLEHSSGYLAGTDGAEAVAVSVSCPLLAGLLPERGLPEFRQEAAPAFLGKLVRPALLDCGRQLARELRERAPGGSLIVEGLSLRLWTEALRHWPISGIELRPLAHCPRLPRRDFIRAYEFMRWCRKDQFRLRHVSQLLGSSEERFARLFLAAAGAPPAHFFNELLMDRGREWLRDLSLPVKTIGLELGFRTSSHFIAAFRRRHGTTPQEYRRRSLTPG